MKKVKFFGLAGFILLASGAGFSSCSSDSADPTGGTGVAGQVVKTQFYLNIPYAGNEEGGNARVSTRMTEHYTQNDKKFLGLSDMEMFSFDGTPGTGADEKSTSTAAIYLGTSGNASSKKEDLSGANVTSWRSVYRDIAIPVGTKNIILYAKAPRDLYNEANGQTTNRNNFQAGYLSKPYGSQTNETALSNLNFNLGTICSTANFAEDGKDILTALNTIAGTSIEIGDESNKKTIKWSNVTNFTDFGTENERVALASRYKKFIKLTAGSANSVKRLITDLKAVIGGKNGATENELAKKIIENCNTALNTTLKDITFPRDKNLPDGVAKVQWNTDQFAFVDANSVGIGATSGGNNIDYTKITYPAELAYFVSSPVKTSQDEITAIKDLPSYDDWLKENTWASGYKNVVENRTRFVALQNPLQYGVACLISTIKCNGTSLEDNAKDGNFGYENNNNITVPTEGFKVTGILVGGQPQGVAWNFEPNTSTSDFKYTIYDNDMNSGFAAKSTDSKPNYTLVLDNKDASGSSQSNVFVTVELENNSGVDFYGAEDIIPANSKFYLVGELKLEGNTTTNVDHVFVKDHTTVANFTIKDLKKAYNHIPDMRTSKINVGLAVDLSWKSGIEFNVDL